MEDYVNGVEALQPLFGRPHHPDSYPGQILDKDQSGTFNRKLLKTVLMDQYASIDIASRYPRVHDAILEIGDENAMTVVTGHQLCLFTGPLYFIYKIVNTIRLAEELSERTKRRVVPIFWMATEDHDFDEVNHVWLGDLKYEWKRESGDAVGRLSTDGIESVVDEVQRVVDSSLPVEKLLDLFRRCYRPGQTLAAATRELVTELFGNKGLVIIDGDDSRLKSELIPVFESELVGGFSQEAMGRGPKVLDDVYHQQVTPRDINLFYLKDGMRYRLTRRHSTIYAVDSEYSWSQEDVVKELHNHPERFSPNVVLRPVYQEYILPNLAYIGGGGELAYWLQLKPVFDALTIPMPVLRLRNSVGFIRRKVVHKMDKLELGVTDLAAAQFEARRDYFRERIQLDDRLSETKAFAQKTFDSMFKLAAEVDPSLKGTAEAYNARQQHLLDNFEKKILRSEQRRHADVTRMFEEVYAEAFPGGGLQERRDTYITLVERFGPDVLELLYDELDPFAHDFSWFIEA